MGCSHDCSSCSSDCKSKNSESLRESLNQYLSLIHISVYTDGSGKIWRFIALYAKCAYGDKRLSLIHICIGMKLFEKTINSTSVFDGRILHITLDDVELEDGKKSKRCIALS